MLFVLGGVAVVAFVALVVWADRKRQDEILDLTLAQIHREARTVLSKEDLGRLGAELRELAEIGREMHRGGVSARTATRMGKQAAIESIANAIAVERVFSPKGREAA